MGTEVGIYSELHNNYERAVFGKHDSILPRERARYEWAKTKLNNGKILDIGCSSGFGSTILNAQHYLGLDYDDKIIQFAKQHFKSESVDFTCKDINEFTLGFYDTIVAFEVIEHLDNGKELAQKLKGFCDKLLISTPYKEPIGLWGQHHKLHGLKETDFPGFVYYYMQEDGTILDHPTDNLIQLMLMEWKPCIKEKSTVWTSIVIPTWNKCEELLKPCCESIIKYTNLEGCEVVIVANGCTDNTREYVESLGEPFKLIWFDEQLGYTRATNEGLKVCEGEFIVLLNNDCVLLEQPKNQWINMLQKPFIEDHTVAVSGPSKHLCPVTNREFIIFYCAMTTRSIVNRIGLLDLAYNPGAGEDTSFCIDCQNAGFKIVQVPEDGLVQIPTEGLPASNFMIYHPDRSSTMHELGNYQEIFDKNSKKLAEKYNEKPHVLCEISTKGRLHSTLPMTLTSILNQTKLPDELVIFDDDFEQDPRTIPIYNYLLNLFLTRGVHWYWLPGMKKGQHHNHQLAQDRARQLVFRVDDDVILAPDHLEKLLECINPTIGAVGGCILTPPLQPRPSNAANVISDLSLPNVQWFDVNSAPEQVEHLHCSFLYRKGIAKYDLRLSQVAHREETIFSYSIHKEGYKLIFQPKAKAYHLRNPEGGIRSFNDPTLYEHDEQIFNLKLAEWGIDIAKYTEFPVVLDGGLGDHLVFRSLIDELKRKRNNIVLYICYPDLFQDCELPIRSIEDAKQKFKDIMPYNIYKFMTENNWKDHISLAYKKMYGF